MGINLVSLLQAILGRHFQELGAYVALHRAETLQNPRTHGRTARPGSLYKSCFLSAFRHS